MSAFIIFHSTIKDPADFSTYASAVADTLKPYDGTVIKKGKTDKVLTGEHRFQNVGIISFPSLENAHDWYHSTPYQTLIPIRDSAADMTAICYSEP